LKNFYRVFTCLLLVVVFGAGCNRSNNSGPPQRVVLYCSVDEVYAKPIIKRLEERTGLRIDALYDTEAAKTAGLANRIRAEKSRPRGDVFWSSALLQTLLLQREELLQPYVSPSARYIPPSFKDSTGAWTGLGVRARVLVYQQSVKDPPRTLQDLLQPRFKGQIGISNPQFGTGSDWVAALATRQGADKTIEYFRALKKNDVRVLPATPSSQSAWRAAS
jgi:iron(III) transport system substrate-binding protein